jgi:hypothetical protein
MNDRSPVRFNSRCLLLMVGAVMMKKEEEKDETASCSSCELSD